MCCFDALQQISDPDAGNRVYTAKGCPLETLVSMAGPRGCSKSHFGAAKGEMGLDEYEEAMRSNVTGAG